MRTVWRFRGLTGSAFGAAVESLRPSDSAPAYGSAVGRFASAFVRSVEGAEKVLQRAKSVSQRLKPLSNESVYGTAEAVPLSKTRLFRTL